MITLLNIVNIVIKDKKKGVIMNIIANVNNGNKFLIADKNGFSIVDSSVIQRTLYQTRETDVFVSFKDKVSKKVVKDYAINKSGMISKRYGEPLLIRNVQPMNQVIKPIINGTKIGKGIFCWAESYEGDRRCNEKDWKNRVFVYFPDIDISFNYTRPPTDIELLLKSFKVFKACKEYTDSYDSWKYMSVINNVLHPISYNGYDYIVEDFIRSLIDNKIIKDCPILNLSEKCISYNDGSHFSGYKDSFGNAWIEMLQGIVNKTNFRVSIATDKYCCKYKIVQYSDYNRTKEVISAVLSVDMMGNIRVQDVVKNDSK